MVISKQPNQQRAPQAITALSSLQLSAKMLTELSTGDRNPSFSRNQLSAKIVAKYQRTTVAAPSARLLPRPTKSTTAAIIEDMEPSKQAQQQQQRHSGVYFQNCELSMIQHPLQVLQSPQALSSVKTTATRVHPQANTSHVLPRGRPLMPAPALGHLCGMNTRKTNGNFRPPVKVMKSIPKHRSCKPTLLKMRSYVAAAAAEVALTPEERLFVEAAASLCKDRSIPSTVVFQDQQQQQPLSPPSSPESSCAMKNEEAESKTTHASTTALPPPPFPVAFAN